MKYWKCSKLAIKITCTSSNFPTLFWSVLHDWVTIRIFHCVKSVQIRSYFWSLFSVFGLVNLRIQSGYRKIRTRNNSVFGHFSRSFWFLSWSRPVKLYVLNVLFQLVASLTLRWLHQISPIKGIACNKFSQNLKWISLEWWNLFICEIWLFIKINVLRF